MYKFTNFLPPHVCRICGGSFSKDWSSGGVGAVCHDCFDKRMAIDLINLGIVRNIKAIPTESNPSFTFEANIDGKWYRCVRPCGDWSYVEDGGDVFSVPVGYWELKTLYCRHY